MEGITLLIILMYLVFHIPAIVLLVMGLIRLKTKPENAKKLLIAAGIYFLIGGGICGSLVNGTPIK